MQKKKKKLTNEKILEIIKPLLSDCDGNDCSKIEIKSVDDNLYADLGMTSLTVVESIILINERFGIDISDDEIQTIRTVNDLINNIQKHIKNEN